MEPTLEDISDYNTLKGDKKKTVWIVIISGLIVGAIYAIAYNIFTDSGDAIKTKDTIDIVPLSKSIPVR